MTSLHAWKKSYCLCFLGVVRDRRATSCLTSRELQIQANVLNSVSFLSLISRAWYTLSPFLSPSVMCSAMGEIPWQAKCRGVVIGNMSIVSSCCLFAYALLCYLLLVSQCLDVAPSQEENRVSAWGNLVACEYLKFRWHSRSTNANRFRGDRLVATQLFYLLLLAASCVRTWYDPGRFRIPVGQSRSQLKSSPFAYSSKYSKFLILVFQV